MGGKDRGSDRPTVVVIAGPDSTARLGETLARDGLDVDEHTTAEPDVLVVVAAPQQAGEQARTLRRRFPAARLVVVTATPNAAGVRDALAAGVDGLVLESEADACLAPAVRAVALGLIVVPAALRPVLSGPVLSSREKQALAMVVMGFSNREIADKLYVTEGTVKSHLSSAYRKLGVRSRTEATSVILDPRHGYGTGILTISRDDDVLGA